MREIQGRILGIDYGTKRIGIAVSDPMRIIARSVVTLSNTPKLFEELHALISQYQIEIIIVGNPLTLKGEKSFAAMEVEQFVSSLREIFHGEIVFFDERFTSVQANAILFETKKKKQRRDKSLVDKVAASVLLQNYLDQQQYSSQ